MATVNAVIQNVPAYTLNGSLTFPSTEGGGSAEAITATVNAVFPPPQIMASASPPNAVSVNATLPLARVSVAATAAPLASVSAVLPMVQAAARTGAVALGTLPMAQVNAAATAGKAAQVSAVLPMPQVVASARSGLMAGVIATLPMAQATARTGARASAALPMAQAVATATTGNVARVAATLPMAQVSATASRRGSASVNATLPMVQGQAFTGAVMVATLPMIRVEATGRPLVVQVKEAYSATVSDVREGQRYDLTHYTGWPFIDIVRLGNRFYGVTATAIHELGGNTDNGQAIPWRVETLITDFGDTKQKTLVSAYVGGRHSPQATYTIRWGDLHDDEYVKQTTHTGMAANTRQRFGIGRKARFYSLGMADAQGDGMHIENIELEVGSLTRRIAP